VIVAIVCVLFLFLTAYLVWILLSIRKGKKALTLLQETLKNKHRIILYLSKKAGQRQLKITIMEDLEIDTKVMKNCVKTLKEETIITESKDAITLTNFGKNYAKVFLEKEVSDG